MKMAKRFKVNKNADKKAFIKSGQMMNSKNLPKLSRGGIRF